MVPNSLDLTACRQRQQRLLEASASLELDAIVVMLPEHVQWLAGPRMSWQFLPAAALTPDGRLVLAMPHRFQGAAAADEVVRFDAQWHSTLRNDQRAASTAALFEAGGAPRAPRRLGVEFSTFGRHAPLGADTQLVDIEPLLYRLRRRKDPDELALIRHAIGATEKMYRRAREIIAPGVDELTVFNELQSVAVVHCGEPLTATGNDYQCQSRGGPPRAGRRAAVGDLYILDLGPAFRGYFADNCRTIAVTRPTDEQSAAWQTVVSVLQQVERTVRPGKSARELFAEAEAVLNAAPLGRFNHHLGHGIGLYPHEAPHLNPHWDEVFEEGDVFTAEPGLYAPELQAGLRIENNYRVTANGVELLSDFALEL